MPKTDPPQPEPHDGDVSGQANLTNLTENDPILSKRGYKNKQVRRFLRAYAETGYVNQACEVAGISRELHYHKLKTDSAYQRAFEEAQEQVGQLLEDTAVRRAYEGVKKQVFYQGEPVMLNGEYVYETEYSDHLLHVLLKRFRRELYKDRVEQQITGEITVVERIGAARKRVLEMNRSA